MTELLSPPPSEIIAPIASPKAKPAKWTPYPAENEQEVKWLTETLIAALAKTLKPSYKHSAEEFAVEDKIGSKYIIEARGEAKKGTYEVKQIATPHVLRPIGRFNDSAKEVLPEHSLQGLIIKRIKDQQAELATLGESQTERRENLQGHISIQQVLIEGYESKVIQLKSKIDDQDALSVAIKELREESNKSIKLYLLEHSIPGPKEIPDYDDLRANSDREEKGQNKVYKPRLQHVDTSEVTALIENALERLAPLFKPQISNTIVNQFEQRPCGENSGSEMKYKKSIVERTVSVGELINTHIQRNLGSIPYLSYSERITIASTIESTIRETMGLGGKSPS